MRYYEARVEQYYDELAFKYYITDALYVQGHGQAMGKRFVEIMEERNREQVPEKPPEEIAVDIIKRMGLKFE